MKILQGIDLVKVERMEQMIGRKSGKAFLNRVFSPAEQTYCGSKRMKFEHYAARFAAKEAVVKALGTRFSGGIHWKSFEIFNDDRGCPYVRHGETGCFPSGCAIKLSIAHDRHSAIATALIDRV